MSKICIKKLNALKNIFNCYETYMGNKKSMLEFEINKIMYKLTDEEYQLLLNAFHNYAEYIFSIFANTRRVFIKLNNEEQNLYFDKLDLSFKDLDTFFEDLE